MPELIMLKGLPGSGKSTLARKMVDGGYFRVSLDDLRASMHNGWTKANEKVVQSTEEAMVTHLLRYGNNVIVDDTNVTYRHYKKWGDIAVSNGAEFKMVIVDTPYDECVQRDSLREGTARVGEAVIQKLAKKWEDITE